jgi:hypothetical protein
MGRWGGGAGRGLSGAAAGRIWGWSGRGSGGGFGVVGWSGGGSGGGGGRAVVGRCGKPGAERSGGLLDLGKNFRHWDDAARRTGSEGVEGQRFVFWSIYCRYNCILLAGFIPFLPVSDQKPPFQILAEKLLKL